MELSLADCVVAVTPSVKTPELAVKPLNKVSLVAISTLSTVPETVIFPVTVTPPESVAILAFPLCFRETLESEANDIALFELPVC